MPKLKLSSPTASRQLAFHQLLVAARKKWLSDALSEALNEAEPKELKKQLSNYVPEDAQRILAAAGIRDEHVFPTPILLQSKPTLVGYYRLLLGAPQKTFYRTGSGMARFRSMEMRGTMNEDQKAALPEFCKVTGRVLADLVRQMSPGITERDVRELPLLTIGAQLQGSNNNRIGQQAILDAFLSVNEIVGERVIDKQERRLVLRNSAGRRVFITVAGDPDLRVEEEFPGKLHKKVAIEVKGGTDKSNAYNRAGEAEKSHLKARGQGFEDCWTIIAKKGIDLDKLQESSPTTRMWFDAAQVLGREGEDWQEFKQRLAGELGIPLK